ncbi:lipoprotein [Haemophilus parahaemolyticus]|uniref:Predicted small periplasmic lipoprotein n=1 Tax=Haemophilus parahaemolyticus TaxID=735 RepID=A0A377HZN0_HAEPH|nr:lipoprotein [Haemophilus parahaemolyticus]MDQ6572734.1 lipoprotein [Haemophilus parahaemolyticus]MDU4464939.1 lipoprotein [Haemophilus parahaemolyticus]STO63655.1 Predicted small periplasmic lipoprotein [Haemophilus parahaemolyticus]
MKKFLLLVMLASFLTACGVKGVLYFPENVPVQQSQN